jgi:very-short-patch-repair endonuclease
MSNKKIYREADFTIPEFKKNGNTTTNINDMLWLYLKTKPNGFKFYRLHPVGNYIIGFYCPQLRLAIELTPQQDLTREQMERNNKRQMMLESEGLRFFKFEQEDGDLDMEVLMEKIDALIYEVSEKDEVA